MLPSSRGSATCTAALEDPGHAIKQRNRRASKNPQTSIPSTNGTSRDHDSDVEVFTPPSFTVKDLLDAIPKHCFERSAFRSFSYLLTDLTMLGVLVYCATFIDSSFNAKDGSLAHGTAGSVARFVAWSCYVFAAGSVVTGVWVIAHECGHQAFSTCKKLNNTVGLICHSALLVPYHGWRISHAQHHAGTGSIERDATFVPKTRSEFGFPPASVQPEQSEEKERKLGPHEETTLAALDEVFEDSPLWVLLRISVQQVLGWPLYLLLNTSGHKYGRWTNHFDPDSPLFMKRHRSQILISNIGILVVIAALATWVRYRGFGEVARYYILPYLVVNHHLVMITYLQHTDPRVAHYRNSEWTFPRGALCTIDRNLGGRIGAFLFHGICETHVVHHISSKISHYHAWEATEALKPLLGEYYMKSDDNMYHSLFMTERECRYVEDEGSCLFYKNKLGKSVRKVGQSEEAVVKRDE